MFTGMEKLFLLDHTYKINKHKMPVTVFMVSDGSGNGRSSGYAYVADETLTTVSEVLEGHAGGGCWKCQDICG